MQAEPFLTLQTRWTTRGSEEIQSSRHTPNFWAGHSTLCHRTGFFITPINLIKISKLKIRPTLPMQKSIKVFVSADYSRSVRMLELKSKDDGLRIPDGLNGGIIAFDVERNALLIALGVEIVWDSQWISGIPRRFCRGG